VTKVAARLQNFTTFHRTTKDAASLKKPIDLFRDHFLGETDRGGAKS